MPKSKNPNQVQYTVWGRRYLNWLSANNLGCSPTFIRKQMPVELRLDTERWKSSPSRPSWLHGYGQGWAQLELQEW